MRFAILTQYYPPEFGAPQARLSGLAKYLCSCGHEVTVLTAMPNYPLGRLYDGYNGLLMKENLDGIHVIRTFLCPSQSARVLPRMLNYLSFAASSSLFGSFHLEAPDFLMVESPPLFLGMAGIWLRRLKHSKLIFNVSDLWPGSMVDMGFVKRNGTTTRIAYWLEKVCYQRAWLITGQSNTIVENIRRRFPGYPVFHLSNGVDTTTFAPNRRTDRARAVLGSNELFISVYAGLHGHAQGLRQILEAAQLLRREPEFHFVLIGDGPEKERLQKAVSEMGLSNVRMLDPLPQAEIPGILAAADSILVPLVGQITGAVPSKIYEGMASGRPVVLVATGESAAIVRDYNCGLAVEPNDIQGIAEALRKIKQNRHLARTYGENGRMAAIQRFSRKDIVRRFTEFLVEHGNDPVPACPKVFPMTNNFMSPGDQAR